jgi:hypothetical protein
MKVAQELHAEEARSRRNKVFSAGWMAIATIRPLKVIPPNPDDLDGQLVRLLFILLESAHLPYCSAGSTSAASAFYPIVLFV